MAIDSFTKAIKLKPDFVDAFCNLANALKAKGELSEAEVVYNEALRMHPFHPDTLNNLANVKRERFQISEAFDLYYRALERYPDFVAAHTNLAVLLQQKGRVTEAIAHYRHAVTVQPNNSDIFLNMANAFKEIGDVNTALVCYQRAIHLNPVHPDAYCSLATLYKDAGNILEAISSFRTALWLKPDYYDAFCSLVHCLQIICDWDDYENRMNHVKLIVQTQLENDFVPSVHPHHSMLYPLTHIQRKGIAAKHASLCLDRLKFYHAVPFVHKSRDIKGRRLRIGYVSSDFCNHPTAHLMQSVPGFHNRENVEVFCYSLSPDDGTTFRSKITNNCEHFVDLSKVTCFVEASKIIYNAEIDILINLNGYTRGARNEIFAMKPAPIQVMWLGYPNTSGSSYMDYIITDEVTSPLYLAEQYSEKLAYMPNSFFLGDHKQMFAHMTEKVIVKDDTEKCASTFENKTVINATDLTAVISKSSKAIKVTLPDASHTITPVIEVASSLQTLIAPSVHAGKSAVLNLAGVVAQVGRAQQTREATGEFVPKDVLLTSRAQYHLPQDAVVFCNFNQLYKIDPLTLSAWCTILRSVEKGVLWLLRFPSAGEKNILEFAAMHNIDTSRIVFSDVAPKEEHVRRGQLADICLDTPLCNGHTTGMDMLWAGTPMITFPQETLASRVAASQLTALGCPELIAYSWDQYINIAVNLTSDHNKLFAIRAKVFKARLTSPLFDVALYTRNLEELFYKMWKRFEENMPPDHIVH